MDAASYMLHSVGKLAIGVATTTRAFAIAGSDIYQSLQTGSTEMWLVGKEASIGERYVIYDVALGIVPVFALRGGYVFLAAPNAAVTDAHLGASQITVWLDESGHNLKFRVKYAGGTLKTGTLALA
jgi:hypothetical protein